MTHFVSFLVSGVVCSSQPRSCPRAQWARIKDRFLWWRSRSRLWSWNLPIRTLILMTCCSEPSRNECPQLYFRFSSVCVFRKVSHLVLMTNKNDSCELSVETPGFDHSTDVCRYITSLLRNSSVLTRPLTWAGLNSHWHHYRGRSLMSNINKSDMKLPAGKSRDFIGIFKLMIKQNNRSELKFPSSFT